MVTSSCAVDPVVARVRLWEALDSRATPTIAAVVRTAGGGIGRALSPQGASVGQFEASTMRDVEPGGPFGALGTRAVCARFETVAQEAAVDLPCGTIELTHAVPGNVATAVSIAASLAAADELAIQPWQYFQRTTGDTATLPCPMVNIFSGGRHASGAGRIQDFLAIPAGAASFSEALGVAWDIRRIAADLVGRRYGSLAAQLVADEGGLALPDATDEEPLQLLTDAIERSGQDVVIGIDVAASQVADGDNLVAEVAAWTRKYPVASVEDVLPDDDWAGWRRAMTELPGVQLVGDDLFATRVERVERAAQLAAANTVLIKPNQVGSLYAAHQSVLAARTHGMRTVLSARSGETEESWLADLAVGWDLGQLKVGSVHRSERLAKYNRLLELEHDAALPYRPFPGAMA